MASKQLKATHLIPNSLSHSGGTITAVFNSGTRQVVLSALTANTLYFLYLRTVSGTPTLFFVTTIPSTYHASFSDAILVGAFMANGLTSVSFGSFVNIEGTPTSDEIQFNSTMTNGGNGVLNAYYVRRGKLADIFWYFSVGSSIPTGSMSFAMPLNLAHDQAARSGDFGIGGTAWARGAGGNDTHMGTPNINGGTLIVPGYGDDGAAGWSNTVPVNPLTASTSVFGGILQDVGITGWTSTPLKDL